MAAPKKLKVFRTPIGFHDAYVAAPSQKAALEAWGSDTNLFAQGVAEQITDPELTKEPLERPGEVIKKLRGDEDEQIRALGATPAKAKRRAGEAGERSAPPRKRKPRPSRAAVDKAEAALERAEGRHGAAIEKLRQEERALDKRRRELERKQRDERARLLKEVEQARAAYAAAMKEWAG